MARTVEIVHHAAAIDESGWNLVEIVHHAAAIHESGWNVAEISRRSGKGVGSRARRPWATTRREGDRTDHGM
jgi:hypothetical protein